VVVNDHREPFAVASHRPLQHLKVPIGIAEGGDRPPPDEGLDANRFALLVVYELHRWKLHEHGAVALPRFEAQYAVTSDDLLWRNTVRFFCERAHELRAASGDDERLEAVGTQVCKEVQHRL